MITAAILAVLCGACSQDAIPTSITGPEQNQLVADVHVQPSDAVIAPDEAVFLSAVVRGARGQVVNGRPVTWQSSDESVAYVDASGHIVAGEEGTAKITANVLGVTGVATIDVRGDVTEIIVDSPLESILEGGTQQLSATFIYSNGARRPAHGLRWDSSNPAIVWVDGYGSATGRQVGETDITVSGRGKRGLGRIKVRPGDVVEVAVTSSASDLVVGDQANVWANIITSKGDTVSKPVAWSSMQPSVASVSQDGTIKALSAGTADIQATVDGVVGQTTVNVAAASGGGGSAGSQSVSSPARVTDLRVSQASERALELSFSQVDDGTGNPASYIIRMGDDTFSWDGALAVQRGDCRAPIDGTQIGATLRCWVEGLVASKSYTFQLVARRGDGDTVVYGSLSNIATGTTDDPGVLVDVTPSSFQLDVGQTKQLSARITDSYGNDVSGTPTWTSTSSSIASVASGGTVTANAIGNASIRASYSGAAGSSSATISQAAESGGTTGGTTSGGSSGGSSTPPPPSGGFGPGGHEPSGMTALIDEDACTKNLGSQWQYGQRWQTHVSVLGDSGSPTGCALQFLYEQGKGDGFSGGAFWNNWGVRPNTMYMRYFVRMSPNWQQHSSGVTKLPYWGAGSGNGNSASEFVATYTQTSNFNVVDQSSTGEDPSFRASGIWDPRTRYYEVEILQYLGTPGHADGTVRAWIDGVEIRPFDQWAGGQRKEDSLVGWQFLNASEPWGFKGIQFAFYWGGCCGDIKQHDDWIRVGGLYVSGK